MISLYKIKAEYIYQSWYSSDIFQLKDVHTERFMPTFGTDCSWTNFKTGEVVNIWDRCMRRITEEETKKILREYNLQKLGILDYEN